MHRKRYPRSKEPAMADRLRVPLFELAVSLSDAMDLVSPVLANHHKCVAYTAVCIAEELDLAEEQQNDLLLAGLLHDSGALSEKERKDLLIFDAESHHRHAELGYRMLRKFKPFRHIADIIRYHHVSWLNGDGSFHNGNQVPMGSHILRLADRVDVLRLADTVDSLIERDREVLEQVSRIQREIRENTGSVFMPELVEAFLRLSEKEYFWFDITSPSLRNTLAGRAKTEPIEVDMDGLLELSDVFRQVIDFRSKYTATHSSGVAASAEGLAELAGFSEKECKMMKVASYLHDLGKLAVPTEILEKPSGLTVHEYNVVKSHPFYSYRILESVSGLEVVNAWASFHHERLDGSGYPFHYGERELSTGSRIMAVADVFTAITEDRPYRKGMSGEVALSVLEEMAESSQLDNHVVSLVSRNFDMINSKRIAAQEPVSKEYQDVIS